MDIPIRKTILVLGSIVCVLIIAGWLTQYYASMYKPEEFQNKNCHSLIRILYLDGEANIPAWFQSMLLLGCAFLLFVSGAKENSATFGFYWRAISIVFVGLSMDEAASIHEGLSNQLSMVLHTSGFLLYAWVIPGGLFVLAFVLWSVPFLKSLHQSTRHRFVVAGATYVLGAIGWEMVGAWYDTNFGTRNLTLMSLNALEETFEAAGILLFMRAILLHLKPNKLNVLGGSNPRSQFSEQSNHAVKIYLKD